MLNAFSRDRESDPDLPVSQVRARSLTTRSQLSLRTLKKNNQNTQILNVHTDFICIAGVKSLLTPIKNDIAENLPQPHFDRNSR